MLKKSDIFLMTLVLLVAGGWWGITGWMGRNVTAAQVEIWQNTVLVGSYPLDSPEAVTIPLSSDLGTNALKIENGSVRMLESTCPDQVCVHTGIISKAGQTLVCLPNRVVVEITGGKEGAIDDLSQ